MPVLKIIRGVNKDATYDLKEDRVVLGRNQDCHVVLNVPAVSREHAIIRKIQGKFYIEDNKSRNKTFVNNQEVLARTPLKDRDEIKICDNVLAFFEKAEDSEWNKPEEEDSSTIQATLNQTSKQALEAQPAERLAMLLELSAVLSRTLDREELFPKIVEQMFTVFRQADRGFIILREDGKLIPRVIRTRRNDDDARFSKSIVNRVLDEAKPILSEDAQSGKGGIDLSQSIADARIRSIMCAPLMGPTNNIAYGVIQLDTQDRFKQFTKEDLQLLLAVAGLAAIALENADMHETIVERAGLERDLKLAKDVQVSFLPKRMPKVPGYEFAAFYESAQEIGGDYYDFIPLPAGSYGIMVGDVAGKGVPAVLLMAKVSSDARFCSLTEHGMAMIIGKLNEHMQEAGQLDRFVTLAAGLLDPATHEVTFVNAGHPPPLIYRMATDTFEDGNTQDQAGLPLGIIEGIPYEANTVTLGPGDAVLIYTDGITESRNKDEKDFRMDGVIAALRAGPITPRAMLDRVVAAVHKHATGRKPHDDLTVVSFGRLPK